MEHILHKLGLKLAMSAERQKKYISTGLSYSELITHLTPELLKDSGISIRWLDQEAVCLDGKMLLSPCELESHLELSKYTDRCTRRALDVAVQYVRRLARLHAEGHPLVSTWDDTRMFDRALSWAGQFAHSEANEVFPGRFFEKRLAEAVHRTGLTPQVEDRDNEQNVDATDEQSIPQAD